MNWVPGYSLWTHTLRAWHQHEIVNRWTTSQEPHYKLLWQPHEVSLSRFWCSIAHVHWGHHTRQHMTERCLGHTGDKWPFHDEIFIESHDSETLNFFHLHRRLFLLLSGFFLGLRPIMPRTFRRHLQHLPELSLLSAETNPAQAQLSLGSHRQFKAYISCFFPFFIFIGCNSKHLFSTH